MRRPLRFRTAGVAALVLALGLVAAGMVRAQDEGRGRPWLGVYMQQLDDRLRDALGDRDGVLISRVSPDSPAERAGIRRGDLVTRIDGRAVRTTDDLTRAIGDRSVGERVTVTVVRDGDERELEARLAERPSEIDTPRAELEDEDDDEVTPVPRAPRAPAAPRAPRAPAAPHGDFDQDWVRDLQENLRRDLGPNSRLMVGMGRGRLGVRVESLSRDLGEYFEAPGGRGALVIEVLDDTPAAEAGLKAGDVITRVDGREIENSDALVEALRSASGRVELEVFRKGQRRTVEATLRSPERTRLLRAPRGRTEITPRVERRLDRDRDRDRRVIVRPMDDDERAELRREIEELKRELRELREERR